MMPRKPIKRTGTTVHVSNYAHQTLRKERLIPEEPLWKVLDRKLKNCPQRKC